MFRCCWDQPTKQETTTSHLFSPLDLYISIKVNNTLKPRPSHTVVIVLAKTRPDQGRRSSTPMILLDSVMADAYRTCRTPSTKKVATKDTANRVPSIRSTCDQPRCGGNGGGWWGFWWMGPSGMIMKINIMACDCCCRMQNRMHRWIATSYYS
jgi:hypothetical protein